MPDGAPALAFAKLMHEENTLGKENLTYTVVKADNIGGFVANESAAVALMPITGASKVANGKYKAVSVITHGNIFLIGKGDATTLSALKDKKVGVVQLANVPALLSNTCSARRTWITPKTKRSPEKSRFTE